MNKMFNKRAFVLIVLGFVFSPLFLYASQQEIEELKNSVAEKEGIVSGMLNRLNQCRSTCKDQCRIRIQSSCHNQCNDRDNSCISQCRNQIENECTDEKCDSQSCHVQKENYDRHKWLLDSFKEKLAELQGLKDKEAEEEGEKKPGEGIESPLKQVRKKKKDMGLYAALGVGTTAFLTYKAVTCCSSSPACSMCGPYSAMAALAGTQTLKMFQKKNEFEDTEQALCVKDPNNANSCLGDGESEKGGENIKVGDDDTPDPPIASPYCQDNPSHCEPIIPIVTPGPSTTCSPGDTDCLGTLIPPGPDKDIAKELGKAFKPPGGWPNGEDPFSKNKGFSYDQLTPEQKKHIDALMGPMNKQNKGFLKQVQSNAGSGSIGSNASSGSDSSEGDSSEDFLGDPSGASDKSLVAGFSGKEGGSGDRSIDSLSLSDGLPIGPKKKNSLAEQMKDMLKKFHGKGGSGKDTLAKKSVQIGSDVVGVVEDNIFMMVHRRHRALDDQEHFIKSAF